MVLFINVNVGQEVEVYYQGGIEKGVVKYKGGLANTQGDWVGVQLERPVGRHAGIFKGREYFTCTHKHGIFVHPARIRFCALKRTYFNHYRSVSPVSYVEETLFGSGDQKARPKTVATEYFKSAKTGFSDLSASWSAGQSSSYSTEQSKTFNLGHSIGRTYSAKRDQRPKSALEQRYGRVSPMTKFFDSPDAPFISSATVPRTYDPTQLRPKGRGISRTQRQMEWSI